ncbi:TRI16 protein, partial [Polypterus senegalus]
MKSLKFKKTELSPPPSQNYAGTGDVECDACTGKKFRAVKSCLTCLASFCQTHLQPHFLVASWKDHKLTDPDRNLKEKLCAKHLKSLEIFCKTDQTCICMMCVVTGHEGHEKVELETERKEKQKHLGVTQSEIRRRLEEREKKLKETKRTVEKMKISVEREIKEYEKSFTDLIHCIEEVQRKMTEKIRKQENREMEKAEKVMKQLEKEIEELKKRDAELKELSETKDNVHFLQTFLSCCVLPAGGDSLSFTVTANFSSEDLRKELSCLKKSLDNINQRDTMTLSPSDFCPLTLDVNTAHRQLRLYKWYRKVTCERTETEFPNHPDRFERYAQFLCSEAMTGTRYYWEVECTGDFMVIGVTYKGLSRKGDGGECSLGNNDKSWSLRWSHSQYYVCHNNKEIEISAPYSPRIEKFQVIGAPNAVSALLGEDVTLPASLSPALDAQGFDREGRTALFPEELVNGNVSLRLQDVRVSDGGLYTCAVYSGQWEEETHFTLNVEVVGTQPSISISSTKDQQTRLECSSEKWSSQPKVTWRDMNGVDVTSVSTLTLQQDDEGLLRVGSVIPIKWEFNVFSCLMRSNTTRPTYQSKMGVYAHLSLWPMLRSFPSVRINRFGYYDLRVKCQPRLWTILSACKE